MSARYFHAAKLLEDYSLPQKIRLIGVGVSGFKPASIPVQLELFDRVQKRNDNWEKVDRTLENITKKFGRDAIKRATLND